MSLTNPRHAETVEPAVPITTPTEALQRVAAALALAEEKAELGAKTSCSLLLSLARPRGSRPRPRSMWLRMTAASALGPSRFHAAPSPIAVPCGTVHPTPTSAADV